MFYLIEYIDFCKFMIILNLLVHFKQVGTEATKSWDKLWNVF